MELSRIVPLALQFSIMLIVLSIGLKARWQDVSGLWHRPALLASSLFALNVAVPLMTALLVIALRPIEPVGVALMLLAISPVPPILPLKQLKLSSDVPYIYGLLVFTGVVSIVYVPAAVALLGAFLHRDVQMPVAAVIKIVLSSVLGPMAIGLLVRAVAPSVAQRIAPLAGKVGGVLMALALVLMLAGTWRSIFALIGNGTVLVIALVVILSVMIGHLLGGPDADDRAALALAAAARHPAVALAVATVNLPHNRDVPAAILLYLLLNAIFTLPYTRWRSRTRHVESQESLRAAA